MLCQVSNTPPRECSCGEWSTTNLNALRTNTDGAGPLVEAGRHVGVQHPDRHALKSIFIEKPGKICEQGSPDAFSPSARIEIDGVELGVAIANSLANRTAVRKPHDASRLLGNEDPRWRIQNVEPAGGSLYNIEAIQITIRDDAAISGAPAFDVHTRDAVASPGVAARIRIIEKQQPLNFRRFESRQHARGPERSAADADAGRVVYRVGDGRDRRL